MLCVTTWTSLISTLTSPVRSNQKDLEEAAHHTFPQYNPPHCERAAFTVPRFPVFSSSRSKQREKPWLRQLARRQGEGILPQTLTSDFTFFTTAAPFSWKRSPGLLDIFWWIIYQRRRWKASAWARNIAVGRQGHQILKPCWAVCFCSITERKNGKSPVQIKEEFYYIIHFSFLFSKLFQSSNNPNDKK